MPCPYRQHFAFELSIFTSSAIRTLSSVICTLYSIHFLPLRQGEYHEVGRGYVYLSAFRFPFISYPLPPAGLSNVVMGIATLRGHRMTFSHSSKDPLRPLSQRDKVECGLLL